MAKFTWEGPDGYTLVHPATGVPVALEPGQEVDLPDTVAVSADLWTPVTPAKSAPKKKEAAE